MRKYLLYAICATMMSTPFVSMADTDSDSRHMDIAIDTRADFTVQDPDDGSKTLSGFHGRYFNVMLKGTINDKLSYNIRQRLNKYGAADNDIFYATDWIYLQYQPVKNWAFAAGKQVVLIGGYEYDAAPIDIFFASRFWNNIACYQFGASATYITDDGNHQISFQVCNSPYMNTSGRGYAYNLYWSGKMGCLTTLWSVNMLEYETGCYANFIALGNRVQAGDFDLQLDLMNRATRHHKFIAGDYSVIGKFTYNIRPWISVMLKGGYDEFKALPGAPEHVDNPFYGGGFEFYPLPGGSRDLRIHAICDRISDNEGVHTTEINIGLKWRVNLYNR